MFTRLKSLKMYLSCFILLFVAVTASAQVNTGGSATTANHSKAVIGYITQWDAWKTTTAGVPSQGALNHLNIDYSKYTILNFSFFGVANDGSLHSGDYRNKSIYQPGVSQAPAPLFMTDVYSSWDLHILFGELEYIQHVNADVVRRATAQGFVVTEGSGTWSHPDWNVSNQPLPLPLHTETGAPGLLELAHKKGVKVMASVGGWSMCKHFPEMAADPIKRARFIEDCKRLIKIGFDGIDLDWEYPGPFSGMNFTGTPEDYTNFAILIEEIRTAIGPNKLITSCFSADKRKLPGFDWPRISNTLDYFNFMTYDMNGGWSNIAGHNSPMHTYTGAEVPFFNWDEVLNFVTANNIDKTKVNMGIPFYGRGVICDGIADLNAPTVKRNVTIQPDGPISTCADYTNWPEKVYDGTPNYFFIKQKTGLGTSGGWTRHWDMEAEVPYMTNGKYFLSYDDVESVGVKSNYIVQNQLAGTIIWTVYGDLEISGTPTKFGPKLVRYSNVKSELVNKINEVFASTQGTPPSCEITSPLDGTRFAEGADIPISGTAHDPDGTVTRVDIYVNGKKYPGNLTIGGFNYTFSTIGLSGGTYSIYAIVYDNQGNSGKSGTIKVIVGNESPIVAVTSPVTGEELAYGKAISVVATASDNDGTINDVQFFAVNANNQQFKIGPGVASGSTYTATWNNAPIGVYTITAVATDNQLAQTTSEPVTNVTVKEISPCPLPLWNPATVYTTEEVHWKGRHYRARWWTQGDEPDHTNPWGVWYDLGPCPHVGTKVPPTVSISSPANNSVYKTGNITIDAIASDSDGTVISVEFLVDNVSLSVDTTAAYSALWAPTVEATYTLTAIATDNDGLTTISDPITVRISNQSPPTVSVATPVDGANFVSGSTINLTANAADADGTVVKVEYFQGTTSLGSSTVAPAFSVDWIGAADGTYEITAVATDNTGLTGTSLVNTITVGSPVPEWQPGVVYNEKDEVSYNGTIWVCQITHTSNEAWYPGAPGLWIWAKK